MKNYLHILVILSFILMGISPACKFISGQVQEIEICTYEGIKTVKIAAHGEEMPADDHHKKSEDCGFCFAQSNLKLEKATAPQVLTPADVSNVLLVQAYDLRVFRPELSAITLRGPPSFSS